MSTAHLRKAIIRDVKPMHQILTRFAAQDLLLPRSLSELYTHLRDHFVLASAKDDILGLCGLGICWDDLAEIKSLAVREEHQGKGYGKMLVGACLEEAERLGLRRVFALTYVPAYFENLGFREVEKSTLPHKIWADCLNCPKFPDCDEVALVRDLP